MKSNPFAQLIAAALVLSACSPSTPPAEPKAAATASAPAAITAPAGQYALDPNHSSISFRVNHLGLSTYVARFAKFDATLNLDPANIGASSVTATVDPASVRTDFPGDYKAGHADSPYKTWDEDLAQSPKFFNAAEHPQATFTSTRVRQTENGALRIDGKLSLLGVTLPLMLEATVVGSGLHPFSKRGAIGFSATGSFNRSAFGMTHLLQPLLVGDAVTIQFEGEFQQVAAQPAS